MNYELYCIYTYQLLVYALSLKLHNTIYLCKYSVVYTKPDILSGIKLCSSLSYNNAAGRNYLTPVSLNAKPFSNTVSSIRCAALTLFMCHNLPPKNLIHYLEPLVFAVLAVLVVFVVFFFAVFVTVPEVAPVIAPEAAPLIVPEAALVIVPEAA